MLVGTIQHPLPTVKCISYSTHVLLLNYFRDTCHYLSYKNKIIIKNNVQCAIGYILNEFITFTVLGTNCHYTGKIKLIKLLIRNEKRRNLLYFNILLSVIESISNLQALERSDYVSDTLNVSYGIAVKPMHLHATKSPPLIW